ncbi:MAG: cell envelope integrity protein TolA [Xanthobacteraceae bacterium]
MRTGLAVSSIGHAVLLGWGLITFAPSPLEVPPTEAMPVDLVPITDITQLQAGSRSAPKQEKAKQAADKIAEPKQAPEPEKKPNKPEVKTAAAPPPPPQEAKPEPLPKKEEVKPDPKPEPVAAPLPPKRVPPKPKTPETAKADTPKQRDFNPDKIAALLDRREPQRQRAADEVSPTAALGASTGNAPRLTQSEIDALRAQIQACWNPPVGAENAQELIVRLRVQFRTDGTLSAEPALVNSGSSPYFRVAAESAMRAVRRCQPYTLPAAKYEVWRDVEVTFDPRDMFGG